MLCHIWHMFAYNVKRLTIKKIDRSVLKNMTLFRHVYRKKKYIKILGRYFIGLNSINKFIIMLI